MAPPYDPLVEMARERSQGQSTDDSGYGYDPLQELMQEKAQARAFQEAFGRNQGGITRSLEAGWENTKAGIADAVGTFSGSRSLQQYAAERRGEAAGLLANSGAPQSLDEIEGPLDAAKFLGSQVLQQAGPIGSMVVSGGAAGLGLRVLGAGAAAVRGGTVAGAMAPSSAMGASDIFEGQREQVGEVDLLSGAVGGLGYGALDTLTGVGGRALSLRALGGRGLGEFSGNLPTRIAKAAGRTAVEEGIAEGGQQSIVEGARAYIDPNASLDDVLQAGGSKRIRDAAITGALVGGVIGGATPGKARASQMPIQEPPTPENGPTAEESAAAGLDEWQRNVAELAQLTRNADKAQMLQPATDRGETVDLLAMGQPEQGPPERQGPPVPASVIQGPRERQGPPEAQGPTIPQDIYDLVSDDLALPAAPVVFRAVRGGGRSDQWSIKAINNVYDALRRNDVDTAAQIVAQNMTRLDGLAPATVEARAPILDRLGQLVETYDAKAQLLEQATAPRVSAADVGFAPKTAEMAAVQERAVSQNLETRATQNLVERAGLREQLAQQAEVAAEKEKGRIELVSKERKYLMDLAKFNADQADRNGTPIDTAQEFQRLLMESRLPFAPDERVPNKVEELNFRQHDRKLRDRSRKLLEKTPAPTRPARPKGYTVASAPEQTPLAADLGKDIATEMATQLKPLVDAVTDVVQKLPENFEQAATQAEMFTERQMRPVGKTAGPKFDEQVRAQRAEQEMLDRQERDAEALGERREGRNQLEFFGKNKKPTPSALGQTKAAAAQRETDAEFKRQRKAEEREAKRAEKAAAEAAAAAKAQEEMRKARKDAKRAMFEMTAEGQLDGVPDVAVRMAQEAIDTAETTAELDAAMATLNKMVENAQAGPTAAERGVEVVRKKKRTPKPPVAERLTDEPVINTYTERFSRLSPAEKRQEVADIVYDVTKNWRNAPEIIVMDPYNPRDADEAIFAQYLKPSSARMDGSKGLYDSRTRKIYLPISNHTSVQDLRATIFHEALGHYGLHDAFNKSKDSTMVGIYRTLPAIRRAANEIWRRQGPRAGATEVENQAYYTEEALVQMLESGEPVAQTLMSRLRDLFRRFTNMMGWTNAPISEADVIAQLNWARENVISGAPSRDTLRRRAFQRAPMPPQFGRRDDAPRFRQATTDPEASVLSRAEKAYQAAKKLGAPDALADAAVTMADLTRKMKQGLMFGHDLAEYMAKIGIPSYARYNEFMQRAQSEANRATRELDQILVDAQGVQDQELLSKAGRAITRTGKWGYQPTWEGAPQVVVDPDAAAKWEALPADVRTSLDAMFAYNYRERTKLQQAVTDYINKTADQDLADPNLTAVERKRIERMRARQINLFDKQVPKMEGPYLPLSRFGNYVTVGKSAEFIALEQKMKQDAGQVAREDREQLDEMRTDPKHYAVMFFDGLSQAKAAARELEKDGLTTYASERVQAFNEIGESPLLQMQKFKDMMESELPDSDLGREASQKVSHMLRDLYISTLAEQSARKYDKRRLGVAGESTDILRSQYQKGRADAHFLAQMLNRAQINSTLQSVIREAGEPGPLREDKMSAAQEAMLRHVAGMQMDDTPLQDKAMALSSLYFLMTSPRYYLMNLAQPQLYTTPMLAGRYGLGAAQSTMFESYRHVAGAIKQAGAGAFARGKFSVDSLPDTITADEKAMLHEVQNLGKLDFGINYDAGQWNGTSYTGKKMQKIIHMFRTVSGQVELVNRTAAGLSTYRLAKKAGKSHDKAVAEAVDIINQSQYDYSRGAAPRYFNALPKMVTQFRKYQVGQIWMFAKLARNAIDEVINKGDTEGKYVATKTLGFMLGQLGLVTGAIGLPAAQLVGVAGSMLLGDDDEPVNGERWLDEAFGDGMGKVILRGVPSLAGIELADLGAGRMLNPFAYADYTQIGTREGFAETAIQALGPTVGLAQKLVVDVPQAISRGDYVQAATLSLPNFATNAYKGWELATEGLRKRTNGDMLLSPDEIAYGEAILQAIGFTPAQIAEVRRNQSNLYQFDQYYKDRTSSLKRAYTEAVRSNDTATAQAVIRQWQAVQESRIGNGFKRQPLSQLLAAPAEQKRRERNTVNGVQVRTSNRGFVEQE